MRKLIILFTVFIICIPYIKAQSIDIPSDNRTTIPCYFTYDSSGNMIKREVIYLLSKNNQKNTSAEQDKNIPDLTADLGDSNITIYPNPTKGKLKIAIDKPIGKKAAYINIYDYNGNILIQKDKLQSENLIDMTPYTSGTYIMTIRIGAFKKEYKIVKQ